MADDKQITIETIHHLMRMNEEKFDMIDKKLDKFDQRFERLTDAMIGLAKTEEKILALDEDRKNLHSRLNDHGVRIVNIEKNVLKNDIFSTNSAKFIWLAVAGLIGAILTKISNFWA